MSWVVDVSRCLGLMDMGSRDVCRRGPGPSASLRRHAKSSTWLLGSPLSRGSSQVTVKKRLHRSGSRSTPCLTEETTPGPAKKSQADLQGRSESLNSGGPESLTSTPATSSVDSLETEPPLLPPPASDTLHGPSTSALVLTMPYVPAPRPNLARSCEVLGMTECEASEAEGKTESVTPARARSVSRLDCSVNYSDSPPLVPALPPEARDSPRGVFMQARDTLVNRLCGAGPRGPPLPDTEHPTRKFRARHRFARSEHNLNQPIPQRRVSHHAHQKEREGVGARSRSEHALIRPSWSLTSQSSERACGNEWSIWAQDLLDSLHQMNAHAQSTSPTFPPTSALTSAVSSRASLLARSRGSSEDNQVSAWLFLPSATMVLLPPTTVSSALPYDIVGCHLQPCW